MEINLNELTGEEILKSIYGKELTSKKSILEVIDILKPLAKESLSSEKMQEV